MPETRSASIRNESDDIRFQANDSQFDKVDKRFEVLDATIDKHFSSIADMFLELRNQKSNPENNRSQRTTPSGSASSLMLNRKYKIRRRISCEEMDERRLKGLCLFCEEAETPDHYLQHKNSGILMLDSEDLLSNAMELEEIGVELSNSVGGESETAETDNNEDRVRRDSDLVANSDEKVTKDLVELDGAMSTSLETSFADMPHRIRLLNHACKPPESSSEPAQQTKPGTMNNYSRAPRLAKLDFPWFSGDKVQEWLFKVAQFFEIIRPPDELKISLASIHFDGLAATWHQSFAQLELDRTGFIALNAHLADGRGAYPRSNQGNDKIVVAVDIDEVLGNFVSTLNRFIVDRYLSNHSVSEYHVYEFFKIWNCSCNEADIRVHEFFKTSYFEKGIYPLPGAHKTLHKLSRYCDLSVVTSRQNAIKEHTLEWIDIHFPGLFKEIHFGNHFALDGESKPKSEICRSFGAEILIDDNPRYAVECANIGKEMEEDIMGEDQRHLQGDSEPLTTAPDFDTKVSEIFDKYIRKRGTASTDREIELHQPTLKFSMWIIQHCLSQYTVLLLALVVYATRLLVGIGLDKTQSRLSLQTNRVWDPGGFFDEYGETAFYNGLFTSWEFLYDPLQRFLTLQPCGHGCLRREDLIQNKRIKE